MCAGAWAGRTVHTHTARLGITRLDRITIDRDHTGGAEILRLSRDRFEDCTHVFESHHHDYKRARAVLAKYKVPTELAHASIRHRPAKPPPYQLNGRDGPPVRTLSRT